jgi:NSS family neurotransmitter:Na+ symporter
MPEQNNQQQWSSYWGFVLAAAGAAVGLGNIWKFPYIAGENGGGAFVIIYLLCILFIGLPLLMAEVMLGRRGRQNPMYAMSYVAEQSGRSKHWGIVGGVTILSSFIILSYYSVIAGWALDYVFQAISGGFYKTTKELVHQEFNALVINPWELTYWNTIILGATMLVVSLGVEKGLERAVRYMFPAMFVLLLVIVGYAMTTGHFYQGVEFLFKPDFSKISAHGVLEAVGHSFFTLSLATGSIMMYGAYLPKGISIAKTSFFICLADTSIALVAGLAIFPIVFANGLEPGAGPGLIFKSLPLAFGHMHYGQIFATLFFMMLVFAAFTSTISLLEPSVSWAMEKFHTSRKKATIIIGSLLWVSGFLTIFSFNRWKDFKLLGLTLFEFLDTLTASYMLPLAGLFIAIFAAWGMKKEDCLDELETNGWLYKYWHYCLGIITPIAIILVFLNVVNII